MKLTEIQINKTKGLLFCLDENSEMFAKFDIGTAYYAGTNENGEPRGNAEDGVYRGESVWSDIDYPDAPDLSDAYGWAYLNIDSRGRAIHGGGSNLGHEGAMAPMQPLLPTYGCFRMRNIDIFWLCHYWNEAVAEGIDPCIHVVSEEED